MRGKGLWTAALLLVCGQALAFYSDGISECFGPFRDDEKIEKVKLTELKNLGTTQDEKNGLVRKLGQADESKAPFWVIRQNSEANKNAPCTIQFFREKRKKPLKLVLEGQNFTGAFTADLNGDGKPDYILSLAQPREAEEGSGEEGSFLASRMESFILVLSGKKNYRAYWVKDTDLALWDFMKLAPGADSQVIHTTDFAEPREPKSGQTRVIFHLYQLLSIKGDTVGVDNSLDKRFPKIVAQDMGARHKNHMETKLLTDGRKKELLAKYPPQIIELKFKKK
jgi:hypothetical protein